MEKLFVLIPVIFFSHIFVSASEDEMINKGYTFSEEFKAYYKYVGKGMPAGYGNTFCSQEGARLFSPGSKKEAIFARQLMPKNVLKIWLGTGTSPSDDWTNLHNADGSDASYLMSFSHLNRPQAWSYLTMKSEYEYEFNSWYENLPFICKKNNTKAQLLTDDLRSDLLNKGYVYNEPFNAFYKFNANGVFYEYNYELLLCNFEGGTSFVPESKEEVSVLRDMGISILTYVGISKHDSSIYKTVEGKNISDVYVDWAQNHPNLSKDYVAMDNTGKYYSVDFNGADGYICQIKFAKIKASSSVAMCVSSNETDSQISLLATHEDEQQTSTFFEPISTILSFGRILKDKLDAKKYKYIEHFNAYYKVYEEADFPQWTAALICSSDNSELFNPESENEAKEIFDLLPREVDKIWIGVIITLSGKFHTFTGQLVTNLTIAGDLESKRGVTLNRNLQYENVNHEEGQFVFVCKKSIKPQPQITEIEKGYLMSFGYNFYKEFDAWYKYYDVSETFEFAFVQCGLDGATLFVPKSKYELNEIIRDMEISDTVWLGMTKVLRNYFVTVKGQLASNYYYKWARGQPDLQLDFVVLNKTGQYYTTDKCDKYSFICKRN